MLHKRTRENRELLRAWYAIRVRVKRGSNGCDYTSDVPTCAKAIFPKISERDRAKDRFIQKVRFQKYLFAKDFRPSNNLLSICIIRLAGYKNWDQRSTCFF